MRLEANGSHQNLLITVLLVHLEALTILTPEMGNCIKHILVKMDMQIWNGTTRIIAETTIPIPTIIRLLGTGIIPIGGHI